MATEQKSPPRPSVESLALGVCTPAELRKVELRVALTQGGYEPLFWHDSVDTAIDSCLEREVELFLLGARRPDPAALECVSGLLAASPSTKVILICERSADGDVRRALGAGAHGLVPLGEVADALIPVMEVVRAGQVSVPGSAGKEAARKVLTVREKQILGQVVLGMSNAEIAAKLYLAESTVKSHLSSAFAKLGVASRNEATALILDPTAGAGLGILTIPTKAAAVSA